MTGTFFKFFGCVHIWSQRVHTHLLKITLRSLWSQSDGHSSTENHFKITLKTLNGIYGSRVYSVTMYHSRNKTSSLSIALYQCLYHCCCSVWKQMIQHIFRCVRKCAKQLLARSCLFVHVTECGSHQTLMKLEIQIIFKNLSRKHTFITI